MTTGERIKERRLELGLSVEDVAQKLGKNRATVYRYESDEIENLSISIIKPLSEVLQVSPAYLMDWENDLIPFKTKRVPLLGEIAAGKPILASEEYETYIEIDSNLQIDFCLKVKGDSMINARIYDGDIVFIRQQPEVEVGEIAAVIIDGEATLKRVYWYPDGIILKPENSKYQPKYYAENDLKDIRILGKAILFQGEVK